MLHKMKIRVKSLNIGYNPICMIKFLKKTVSRDLLYNIKYNQTK